MSEFSDRDLEGLRAPLARELIRAGRSERASASARASGLQAMTAVGTATAAVAPSAWLTVVKWTGLSAFVLGSVGVAFRGYSPGSDEVAQSTPAALQARDVRPPAPAVTFPAGQASDVPRPVASVLSPEGEVGRRPELAGEPPLSAKPSTPALEPRDQRLRQELTALQLAQAALGRGAPAEALAILAAKQGGFQLLAAEAGLVRVDALRGVGQRAAARELALALLRHPGSGPFAHRLQALAERE